MGKSLFTQSHWFSVVIFCLVPLEYGFVENEEIEVEGDEDCSDEPEPDQAEKVSDETPDIGYEEVERESDHLADGVDWLHEPLTCEGDEGVEPESDEPRVHVDEPVGAIFVVVDEKGEGDGEEHGEGAENFDYDGVFGLDLLCKLVLHVDAGDESAHCPGDVHAESDVADLDRVKLVARVDLLGKYHLDDTAEGPGYSEEAGEHEKV